MRKLVVIMGVIVVAAFVATFVRYQSFDACEWIAMDMAERTSVPVVIWRGRVRAEFLLRGIANPDAADCVLAWWQERADGASATP